VGYNSRLDEVQAAVLRVLLPELDRWGEARRRVGATYAEAGLGDHVVLPVWPPGAEPAWHLYVVNHPRADELIAGLRERGVEARAYYRTPLHRQAAMASFVSSALRLPATDELAQSNLALPMSPTLGRVQVEQVVAAVGRVV
jgi:dTDP-3-amino-3,4,6-trideoxy-alpha-D-glucose transaminase